ncbi:hypothetical protein [Alteribacter populi]|uniref:hypothetical protein n=1 Tax=Alteribacter populi TaxID=2011011 RepID=UPI000BBB63CC|nr:hypothetical protein [Alteribacter populi]
MKKGIVTSALAVTMLFGGATYSSAAAGTADVEEKSIELSQVEIQEDVQPEFWAALGRGVAWGVGWAVGENAIGSSSSTAEADYEKVKSAFDL